MTLVRLGYVAMSSHVPNCSPSQTMTFAQFSKIKDQEAALHKLERIAASNLNNCRRLLIHNVAHDIHFFRLTSKIIPLVNHPELPIWDFYSPLTDDLNKIKCFLQEHSDIRIDFHPDHFVILNTTDKEIFKTALKTLRVHERLLKEMGIETEHRCVLHVGGGYKDNEQALEQFIHNWGLIPASIQKMIMLENDDTTFALSETLYLCEKLGVPLAFDYHHHLAHHHQYENWVDEWERILQTWQYSTLRPKMHISSPRSEKDYRAHADYVDCQMFMDFLNEIKGSTSQIDCMIEAKQKDDALFTLMENLKLYPNIEIIDGGSFYIR